MLLEARGLNVRYGRVAAVKDLDIAVAEGQVVTVLGANGAGKSSLLKALIGLVRPVSGHIHFNGQAITHWSPSERVKAGKSVV